MPLQFEVVFETGDYRAGVDSKLQPLVEIEQVPALPALEKRAQFRPEQLLR